MWACRGARALNWVQQQHSQTWYMHSVELHACTKFKTVELIASSSLCSTEWNSLCMPTMPTPIVQLIPLGCMFTSLWVWACRGGVRQPGTGCGHAEVGFDSLELGVGLQRWGSTALGVGMQRWGLTLGVGMQRWGSTALNWVWACRGVVYLN